jgi:hypothetical protein
MIAQRIYPLNWLYLKLQNFPPELNMKDRPLHIEETLIFLIDRVTYHFQTSNGNVAV